MIHGLNGLKDRGHIWVRASRYENRLRIQVEDSGIGMNEEDCQRLIERINSPEERSIGLTNLNRRLILRYGNESRLCITSSSGKGTIVSFEIPYMEDSSV